VACTARKLSISLVENYNDHAGDQGVDMGAILKRIVEKHLF
jgi:hypothetical protein